MDSSLKLKTQKIILKLDYSYDRTVSFLLFVCTMAVLFLSVFVIVLRWFQTTLIWYDPFVRHLVFLLAFLGGVKATREGTHIAIDLVSRSLKSKGQKKLEYLHKIFLSLVSLIVLGWLIYAGVMFTQVEMAYGRPVFLGIHSAFLVGIIPFGFALIFFQFLLVLAKNLVGFETSSGGIR